MKTYSDSPAITNSKQIYSSILKTALPGAIAGGILLIVYFLIVNAFGYQLQTNLRWVNFILIIPVAVYTIKMYIMTTTGKTYLKAFMNSIVSCIGSYLILAIFMVIYLSVNQSFMHQLQNMAYPELQLDPASVFFLIMGEGVIGSIVLSFVILQFYKDRIRKAA